MTNKLVGTGIQMNGHPIEVFIEKVAEFGHSFVDNSSGLKDDKILSIGWL
jgi:hypothetical protein